MHGPVQVSHLLGCCCCEGRRVRCCCVCSYNPYDGPNENPEAELPLVAGKYLYVYGTMDDDGFYQGEREGGGWWGPGGFEDSPA